MSKDDLRRMHEDLEVCMRQITSVLHHYNYDATPTLVLRHKDGSDTSVVISNDELVKVIGTMIDLRWKEVPL